MSVEILLQPLVLNSNESSLTGLFVPAVVNAPQPEFPPTTQRTPRIH